MLSDAGWGGHTEHDAAAPYLHASQKSSAQQAHCLPDLPVQLFAGAVCHDNTHRLENLATELESYAPPVLALCAAKTGLNSAAAGL